MRLSGDFGTAHAPSAGVDGHVPGIVQFSYRSESWAGKLTPSWTAGDTLRVRFDRPVNVRPEWPLQGERAFVDSLFGFSAPLGADYSGGWRP